MGVVYEAEDEALKKVVAIKTIKSGILSSVHVMRFQREANALAALKHPGLVPLYVFGISQDNEPFMVMQFEDGKPLLDIIESRGRLPMYKSVNIFIQVCDAMQHAHSQGVLHRDLKPGNIIVKNIESENPQIVVIDFGIAMVEDSSKIDDLTKTGMLLGTPIYMSPEQIRGHGVDARSDIYAVGCMMFQTLTGKLPFEAPSVLELLDAKTIGAEAPKINSTITGLSFPKGLEEIVSKAIAFSPNSRYQTMEELKTDLIAFKQGDYRSSAEEELFEAESDKADSAPQVQSNFKQVAAIILGITLLLAGTVLAYFFVTAQPKHLQTKIPTSVIDEPMVDISPDDIPQSVVDMAEERRSADGALVVPPASTDSDAAGFIERERDRTYKIVRCIETNIDGTCFNSVTLPVERVDSIGSKISDQGLEAIGNLPRLQELSLVNEKSFSARGIVSLDKAPKLNLLELRNCEVDLPKSQAIAKLERLETLLVEANKDFSDLMLSEILRGALKLKALDISNTKVTAEGIKNLRKLSSLEDLSIRQLHLTDEDLANLPPLEHLKELDIRGNAQISDAGVKSLKKYRSLRVLRVEQDKVSSETKAHLRDDIVGLKMTSASKWQENDSKEKAGKSLHPPSH